MFNVLTQINRLAAALATVALAMLGALWFTALFGRAYAVALGREGAPSGPMAPIFIVGPLVCGLATAVTSAVLMRALGVEGYGDALLFGLIVGLGYLAATTANVAINPNIPRPLLCGLVSGGYFLAASLVISLIVAAMGCGLTAPDGPMPGRDRVAAIMRPSRAHESTGAFMRYNPLGRTGLFVSELCLGTMGFSANPGLYAAGWLEEEEALPLFARAFKAGINLIDTANVYAAGRRGSPVGRSRPSASRATT